MTRRGNGRGTGGFNALAVFKFGISSGLLYGQAGRLSPLKATGITPLHALTVAMAKD
jgi:hypothetical protein